VRSSIRSTIALAFVGLTACGSLSPEGPTSTAASPSTTASGTAESLDGAWSTGPVPLEDVREAMLAAGLDEEAVEGWIDDQGSPPEFTFELRFDSPEFSHSRADANFPMQVDESGTYVFTGGELRISLPDLGDAYVFDATLSDNTLSLELVDQHEEGTVEELETHRLYTVALYASASFIRTS